VTDRRARGTGRLFKRGNIWWIRFSVDGKRHDESSNSTKRSDAVKLLNKRLGEVQTGRYQGPSAERLSFSDLEQMLTDHYHAMRSKKRAQRALGHLRRHLGLYLAKNISADVLTAYVVARREEGASEATIKYELAVLKKSFSLAIRAEKLDRRPAFPTLSPDNRRKGFFEENEFRAVLKQLPEHHRGWALFSFLTGWRAKSELLGITEGYEPLLWANVDFDAGVVRIEDSKNHEGRTFPFDVLPELKQLLHRQREYTQKWERVTGQIIPWVFHRRGERIRDFYSAWRAACERAGFPGKITHDFRRTAVRRLERSGVSRSVAKALVGHKTDSIYERYAIVAEQDLREGVKKVAKLTKKRSKRASGKVLPMRKGTERGQSGG
jgi:integrase